MRKLFFLLFFGLNSLFIIAQTKIATYSSGTFTIDLSSQERSDILDSIASVFGYGTGCTLDSAVINDQDPISVDSAAYVIFYGNCHGSKFSFGIYLTKASNHGDIEYFLDDDSNTVSKVWRCEVAGECNHCGPKRKWFLGAVTGCDCEDCLYSTSGSGLTPGDIITIITFIISLI